MHFSQLRSFKHSLRLIFPIGHLYPALFDTYVKSQDMHISESTFSLTSKDRGDERRVPYYVECEVHSLGIRGISAEEPLSPLEHRI